MKGIQIQVQVEFTDLLIDLTKIDSGQLETFVLAVF